MTVPLFRTWFNDEHGARLTRRYEVAPTVVLAPLDEAEQQRICDSLVLTVNDDRPYYRLELHDVELTGSPHADTYGEASVIELETVLGLLSCVVRLAPTWPTAVFDEHDGTRWVRRGWAFVRGGFETRMAPPSTIPWSRLESWSDLVTNWPPANVERVELALGFYYRSVIDRPTAPYKALASAAIAFEILLGGQLQLELSHRMSTRGALLVERDKPEEVYRLLKSWYGMRSKLVHQGERPSHEKVIRFQQFLMRAIPSMARLTQSLGSYNRAIEALDLAPFRRQEELDGLFTDEPAWWRRVDVLEAQNKPAL